MQERRNQANHYVNAIIKDIQNQFVHEETITFSDSKIERVYEFEDGAVVRYEWQSEENAQNGESFNHRFTLVKLPDLNSDNLEIGVIKEILYK